MDDKFAIKKSAQTVGGTLRSRLFEKLSPVISGSDKIPCSDIRLVVQANCLDIAVAVEEFIDQYGLDCLESQLDLS